MIDSESTSSIIVAKTTTKSSVVAEAPSKVMLSSTPFGGKYKIKCTSKTGAISFSDEISWHHWSTAVGLRVFWGCSQVNDKIQFTEGGKYVYKQNGVSFFVDFEGLNYDVEKLEIVPVEEYPMLGTNVTFNTTVLRPYGTNLFYEPIPFEMLKTFETKPQLIVEVDGLPAVCHNLTCDFTYIKNVGEVTSFTFTETTKELVI